MSEYNRNHDHDTPDNRPPAVPGDVPKIGHLRREQAPESARPPQRVPMMRPPADRKPAEHSSQTQPTTPELMETPAAEDKTGWQRNRSAIAAAAAVIVTGAGINAAGSYVQSTNNIEESFAEQFTEDNGCLAGSAYTDPKKIDVDGFVGVTPTTVTVTPTDTQPDGPITWQVRQPDLDIDRFIFNPATPADAQKAKDQGC